MVETRVGVLEKDLKIVDHRRAVLGEQVELNRKSLEHKMEHFETELHKLQRQVEDIRPHISIEIDQKIRNIKPAPRGL